MAEVLPPNSLAAAAGPRAKRDKAWRENALGYLFAAPAILAIALVLFYPIINLLITSFFSRPTLTRPSRLVGLKNYIEVLTDPIFPSALGNTLVWTLGVTVGQVVVEMFFALLLHQRFPGRALARAAIIIP